MATVHDTEGTTTATASPSAADVPRKETRLEMACHEDAMETIGQMLLIGLQSFGELLRLENSVATHKICGRGVPQDLVPLHPTGSAETVSEFADALRYLESIRKAAKDY